jgi:hypothetical protein
VEKEDEVKLTIMRAKELYNESKINNMLKLDTLSIVKEKGPNRMPTQKASNDRALSVVDKYPLN